jgi:hypothetical protein
MQEKPTSSGSFLAFSGVLTVIATLIGVVSHLPVGNAIARAVLVAGASLAIGQQVHHHWVVPWRDPSSIVGLALALGGCLTFACLAAFSSSPSRPNAWGPRILSPSDTSFTGTTKGTWVDARIGVATISAPSKRIPGGKTYAFKGFCLAPSEEISPEDRRWYVIAHSEVLVPALRVEGEPPAGSDPIECSRHQPVAIEPAVHFKSAASMNSSKKSSLRPSRTRRFRTYWAPSARKPPRSDSPR